jgi:transposase-like protein
VIELEPPRDRAGTFDPQVVKKCQRDISGIEERVISMYAKGMSTRDISAHIHDIYGYELSAETISTI